MGKEQWARKVFLASIPLRELDAGLRPINWGSGCLIDYKGRRFILTVAHNTEEGGNWAIETEFVAEGAKLYQIGPMMFVRQMDLDTGDSKRLDFCYAIVPKDLTSVYQAVTMSGVVMESAQRLLCDISFQKSLDGSRKYGFSGLVGVKRVHDFYLRGELKLELDLAYAGMEDEYFIFELAHPHPGRGYYEGCSGAPIIDSDGKTVALVCGGCVAKNLIYGIPIRIFQPALDVEVWQGDQTAGNTRRQ
jgi:hypothetical protein